VRDSWGFIAAIDCSRGGAQEVFEDLCLDFARAGWELEERKFDWRWAHKGKLRWEICIRRNPFLPADSGSRFHERLVADGK
jgi:hypothetical protein